MMNKKSAFAVILLICLCVVIMSCGQRGIEGTYSSIAALGTGVEFVFSRSGDVTANVYAVGMVVVSYDGTYTLTKDQITLSFGENCEYSGTFKFQQRGNSMTIGVINLKRKA